MEWMGRDGYRMVVYIFGPAINSHLAAPFVFGKPNLLLLLLLFSPTNQSAFSFLLTGKPSDGIEYIDRDWRARRVSVLLGKLTMKSLAKSLHLLAFQGKSPNSENIKTHFLPAILINLEWGGAKKLKIIYTSINKTK